MKFLGNIWENKNHLFLFSAFLSLVLVLFVVLVAFISKSPDEYRYANASYALSKAFFKQEVLTSLNTEHTFLVSFIGAIFARIFDTNNLNLLRYISVGFSLATAYLLYLIFLEIFGNKKQALLALGILLLIPNYFYSSVKFYLEMPTAFSVALFILLLLKRRNYFLIGLSLVLILLIKEYYFFIFLPIAVLLAVFDAFYYQSKGIIKKLSSAFLNFLKVFLPGTIVSLVLVVFNIGPYPRLLENIWLGLFPSLFLYLGKFTLILVGNVWEVFSKFLNQSPPSYLLSLSSWSKTINPGNQFVTRALIEPPVYEDTQNSNKWWLIYKYNFREIDISFLVLVGTVIGFFLALRQLINKIKDYKLREARIALIFLIMFLIMAYFNYHQAKNIHGFRINFPFLPLFIYFTYTTIKSVVTSRDKIVKIIFFLLSITSIILYIIVDSQTSFVTFFSQTKGFALLFEYRRFVYSLLFLTLVFLIFYYQRIRTPLGRNLIIVLIITLFIMRILPSIIEGLLEIKHTGGESRYSILYQPLNEIFKSRGQVYSNIHCERIYYYAKRTEIPNEDVQPIFRSFAQKYPLWCQRYHSLENLWDNIIKSPTVSSSNYILYLDENLNPNLDQIGLYIKKYQANIAEVIPLNYQSQPLGVLIKLKST